MRVFIESKEYDEYGQIIGGCSRELDKSSCLYQTLAEEFENYQQYKGVVITIKL